MHIYECDEQIIQNLLVYVSDAVFLATHAYFAFSDFSKGLPHLMTFHAFALPHIKAMSEMWEVFQGKITQLSFLSHNFSFLFDL